MNKKIIKVCNLNFENVLTNISLEIFEGDFIAILGSNGGGKTTFIKGMTGKLFTLIQPYTIQINIIMSI